MIRLLCFARTRPAAVELSFAVPMAGAVLNMINTRLDAEMVGFILDHGEAPVFMVDQGLAEVGERALRFATVDPLVIDIEDPTQAKGSSIGEVTYEALVEEGSIDAGWSFPPDEWGRDRAQLHVWNNRESEGSCLPSPRSISKRTRKCPGVVPTTKP